MNKSLTAFTAAMSLLSTLSFGSGPAGAQAGEVERGRPSVPCPNPVVVTITRGGTTAATPSAVDFPSVPLTGYAYNQTAVNHFFRDTIAFKKPESKCCQFNPGKLTVTYKALMGGPAKSATSANDTAGLVFHGASVPGGGYIFGNLGTGTGQTVTIPYTVPASIVASGQVSFSAQDDSAVVSATLEISGCCLDPTPSR
jgi:hypothetical protein